MRGDESTAEDRARREREWLRAIAAGDRQAYERLFASYQGPLCRFVSSLVGDAATAEEVAIDVLVEVWRGAARYRAAAKPATWIFGIAHHKAIDALRRRRPQQAAIEEAAALPSAEPDPEQRLGEKGRAARLRAALARLPAPQRAVVELTFFHGLSVRDIAATLGCPEGTVKTRMFHAKRRLFALLPELHHAQ